MIMIWTCISVFLYCLYMSVGASVGSMDNCLSHKVWSGNMSLVNDITEEYSLYRADRDVDWCDAYRACKVRGQSLLSARDVDVQTTVTTALYRQGAEVDFLWLSGRRLDDTAGWTWVNNSLSPCGKSCSNLSVKQWCAKIFFKHSYAHYTIEGSSPRMSRMFMCSDKGSIRGPATWFDAQNACSLMGRNPEGHIRTLAEYTQPQTALMKVYWLMLCNRPWVWMGSEAEGNNSTERRPILYFHNNISSDNPQKSCLAMVRAQATWSWQAVQCDKTTNYILCQNAQPSFLVAYKVLIAATVVICVTSSIGYLVYRVHRRRASQTLASPTGDATRLDRPLSTPAYLSMTLKRAAQGQQNDSGDVLMYEDVETSPDNQYVLPSDISTPVVAPTQTSNVMESASDCDVMESASDCDVMESASDCDVMGPTSDCDNNTDVYAKVNKHRLYQNV